MIYLRLFWEYFQIGLFAVGGGMATLPFLERMSERTGWFGSELITDMIAVSESTPGPIGINMATYVGCNVAGVLGGVVATMGAILPSLVIATVVAKYLQRFRSARIVDDAFYGLRPAVTGLIAAAGIGVLERCVLTLDRYAASGLVWDILDPVKLAFFALCFFLIRKLKLHPVVYIGVSAVVGIVLAF